MNYIRIPGAEDIIRKALREDIGKCDITTAIFIPQDQYVKAILLAKENCVICGLGIAAGVFKIQDKKIKFKARVSDGQKIKKGKIIAYVSGKAQGILTAERVALNFLSLLSGVATKTREYVDKVKPYKINTALPASKRLYTLRKGGVKILDTRKTIPGLRELEKYAVRTGGGYNHRMRLDEMILIKDNHLKVTGGYRRLPEVARGYPVEIEVKNLKEFKEALKLKPDIIMLDNMKVSDIKRAVQIRNYLSSKTRNPAPKLEASGGINLKNIRRIAACGVERVSVGALTHSVKAIDISLEII